MAAALTACGQSARQTQAAHQDQSQGATLASKDSDALEPDMVAAVSPGGSGTPIAMKFRIAARPVVGTPVHIAVALIPATDVEISHIHVSFQPSEGLQLQSERSVDVTDPHRGEAVEQDVTVTPQHSGVLSFTATVVVDLDSGSIARTYAVPLIAVAAAS